MPDCDGYFDNAGIPFEENFQDAAVSYVLHDPQLKRPEKKLLIQCWFDTTFGSWDGLKFDQRDSRAKMADFIRGSQYATFEDAIDANAPKE